MKAIWRRKWFWLVLILVAALIIARAMLPIWVRDYVNRKLSEIPEYRGHVAEVDIHLWRGAYKIEAVEIVKTTGKVPVPFFSAPVVDLPLNGRRCSTALSSAKSILSARG